MSSLRIAVYASPISASFGKPTGVGRHIASMLGELATAQGVAPVVLANGEDYRRASAGMSPAVRSMPTRFLPGPERLWRSLLIGTRLVSVDRWSGDVDWVYAPKEQPVATRRARLAVTIHDLVALEPHRNGMGRASATVRLRWRLLVKRILQRADLIATVSDFTRRRLIEMFGVPDDGRIVVVGNGVSPVFFRSAAEEDEAILSRYGVSSTPYLVAAGSLTARKNGLTILRIAQQLREQGPWTVLVTGRRHDASLVARLRDAFGEGADAPVKLIGYVPDEDLSVLLSHARGLLFLSHYEGFGLPAVEAMAAGAPVICSESAALPEIVGDAGILVGADADEQIIGAVNRLTDSESDRQHFIHRGRQRARQFTWPQCAARLIDGMSARM